MYTEHINMLIQNKITDVTLYQDDIRAMEKIVIEALKETPIVGDIIEFVVSPKDQLKEMMSMLNATKDDPKNGFLPLLESKTNDFKRWFVHNHYGFISDMVVLQNGKLEVTAIPTIDTRMGEKKENLLQYVNEKKNEGFDVEKIYDLYFFMDSDNNKSRFKSLLNQFEADKLKFHSIDSKGKRFLREWSFCIPMSALQNISWEDPVEENKDMGNEKEINFKELKKEISDFDLAYGIYQSNKSAEMASAMETFFCAIADELGIKTKTQEIYTKRYKENKDAFTSISQLKKQISEMSNLENITDFVTERFENIDNVFPMMGPPLTVERIQMRIDGTVEIELRSNTSFFKEKEWDIIRNNYIGEALADTEHNRMKIQEKIPGSEVIDKKVRFYQGVQTLHSMTLKTNFASI